MITGIVLDTYEPVTRLQVLGSGSGIRHEIEAVIDTGFTEFLVLPADLIDALQLPLVGTDTTQQSDGSVVQCSIHEGEIEWDGMRRTIAIQAGGVEALVGMRLLWGYLLTMRCENNGAVTLQPINGAMNEENESDTTDD